MRRSIIVIGIAAALAGCAKRGVAPPLELSVARVALKQAQENPLAALAPAELRRAEEALSTAEREARRRPRSRSARDAAYIAHRRAQCSQLASLIEASRRTQSSARGMAEHGHDPEVRGR
jgi:Domain of unknown function (DUF4398)/Prokaryotic membrane lipoprotein lipid attachment site